jgi:polyhydroxybutyrate depolymerase
MIRHFMVIISIVSVSVLKPTTLQAKTADHVLLIHGTERTFRAYIPDGLASKTGLSLVIALHGGGGNGKAMEKVSNLSETARKKGFIAVYPEGSGRFKRMLTWNAGSCCGYAADTRVNDVAFIDALIRFMAVEYHVDPARVYVTGMSNGAMMAYRLAAEIPERIAAIAPVSGTFQPGQNAMLQPVPVLHFHGTADAFVPWDGGRGSRSLQKVDHAPVEGTIARWVEANRADTRPAVEIMPDRFNDGTTVTRYRYAAGSDSDRVVLYKIEGGGHTWPGRSGLHHRFGRTTREISANDIMWEFFLAHPKEFNTE